MAETKTETGRGSGTAVEAAPLRIDYETEKKTVRVRGTPVLTVTAVYPRLTTQDGDPARIDAFNDGMKRTADAFMTHALGEPARAAADAFLAAGSGAAYCFLCRELLCKMTLQAEPPSDGRGCVLRLTTEAVSGLRRHTEGRKAIAAIDYFTYPAMTVREKKGKTGRAGPVDH